MQSLKLVASGRSATRFLACFTTALATVGCGPSQEEEQDAAQSAAAYHLLDPGSAQFREVEFKDEDTVCGQINGKNRMGAYSGFHDFISYRSESEEWQAELVMSDPYGHDLFREKCIGEAQAQADMEAAMPPITLSENSGAPAQKEFSNGETNAEERCVGSWLRDQEYFQLNYTNKEVRFVGLGGGEYSEPYEAVGSQIRFFEGDEQFAIECDGGKATINNIDSGGTRTYELMRD